MRSPRAAWAWLFEKEWRELLSAPAFWVLLFLTGPLVGVSFMSAVQTYGELSGLNGTAAGVGEAFSPLVGVWAPTFSAYELAAAFLLPFVAIRVVSGDRQSGAAKLELQQPLSPFARITVKAAVLLGGWMIASLAAVVALLLWKSYGGVLHAPEILAVGLGHLLNAGLTIGLAAACASLVEHPATAAILTLGFTVGTWALSFVAAVRGGAWERLAGYTPPVMVAGFQHGLVRLDVVLIALALIVTGLGLAAVWMRIGTAVRRRAIESLAVIAFAAVSIFAGAFVRASVDVSENRQNSFSEADEAALSRIQAPLHVEVHLAPQDPRRYDLDRHVLAKLKRVMPGLSIRYVSATSVGLFEQTNARYGEIDYELLGRTATSRLVSEEAVLETIYALAGVTPPPVSEDATFRGHPLAVAPKGAAVVFYGVWPALVLAAAAYARRASRV